MAPLERRLADRVLFGVVVRAQAEAEPVGGLEPGTTVGSAAHVGALDRPAVTVRNAAAMAPDPRAVHGTGAALERRS